MTEASSRPGAPPAPPRIAFGGVTKRYPARGGAAGGGQGTLALEALDLHIAPAEIVSIVGPTGCGKSTALNLLAGFEAPSSGTIRVDGRPVTGPGADRGVVFQQASLFPWMTVLQNVVLGVRCRGAAAAEVEPKALRLLGGQA